MFYNAQFVDCGPSALVMVLVLLAPYLPNPLQLRRAFTTRPPTVLFAVLGILETLVWAGNAAYCLVVAPFDVWGVIVPFLVAFSWMYPSAIVPYDLFVIYLLHFIAACLELGGALFDTAMSNTPLPPALIMFGLSANLGITGTLLYVTMRMPIGLPSTLIKKEAQ
ncbi:hypothetical protein B0H12DRAFT_1322418 [Mycena haematopus]|nr:hypothetical protein B0H12DRAFT_1322418 [Mycena haematopus]